MYRLLPVRSWVFVIWLIFIGTSLYVRPLFPVDETRYAAVAWEMWIRNDFLVPYLNGETYSHKPPLLFWLMQLTWKIFGVNEGSMRLVSPLFALGTVYLSAAIARLLWPERKEIAEMTPIMLTGSCVWLVYASLTMFDMMLAFFAALGIYSLLKLAYAGLTVPRWLLLGVALGGGVLSKGPVILLHLLPVALSAPWWRLEHRFELRWQRWYAGLLFSVLVGASIALSWAIPAGLAGGGAYRHAIFLGQTQGRLVDSFAHKLPWWWFLQWLPLLLLPWLLLKPLWPAVRTMTLADAGLRFCAAWAVPVFIAFSLISGKRLHYLLPLLPVLPLVLARCAAQSGETRHDWRHSHAGIMAVFGFIGLVLAIAPRIEATTRLFPEMAEMPSLWGILLFIVALVLAMRKAASVRESVFYCALASAAALVLAASAFFSVRAGYYDTRETAQKIAALVAENKEVAYLGNAYHGEYQFSGRLVKPLKVLPSFADLDRWAEQHRDGYVIVRYKKSSDVPESLTSFHHPYKGAHVALMSGDVLLNNPQLKQVLLL